MIDCFEKTKKIFTETRDYMDEETRQKFLEDLSIEIAESFDDSYEN